ncbi:transposase [Crenothrix polyspora]|uniref:Transposase n=1 Tax=Crenothrix polyspora TaxID=360316 RepID=A0A1R4H9A0_9GAMM|nr:ISAzo13 family transposase [Crenothrix polyspora]SJM92815.1 transposase [Crenothrix polyspora]
MTLTPYSPEIERQMQEMYVRLSEKDKRLYAGVEALKLPYGGVSYIAELFGCSRNTVMRGIIELRGQEIIPRKRDRMAGGGRKQTVGIKDKGDIDEVFLLILKEHTAGNPMDEKVKWTNLTKANIAELLVKEGLKVSRNIIVKLLKKHGYVKRKPLKKKAGGGHVDRNAQFERIAELRKLYKSEGNPVISVDTKKKELIGNLSRNGKIYTTETIEVYDHDFTSLAEGVAVPHTIYDIAQNKAYVTIGTSRDTSEFACDSIRQWWSNHGKFIYLTATSILMLMDGGGSNSSRHYIFKQDLQALADELGIDIRVAHYPPHTSKWNPIEHRVFPHITRAMQGMVLTSHELTKELIETATTKAGLSVVACILNKVYLTKRKVAAGFKESMRILFDSVLGRWNYVATPKNAH